MKTITAAGSNGHGMDEDREMGLREAGAMAGISHTRVKKIEVAALRALRWPPGPRRKRNRATAWT